MLLKQPPLLDCILMIVQDTIRVQSGCSWDTVSLVRIKILLEYIQDTSICVQLQDTIGIHTGYKYLCSTQDLLEIHTEFMYLDAVLRNFSKYGKDTVF